jgi:putative flavoprotein involved in K+ transport
MPFPARGNYFPTKDEMADYLESYATRFNLPVQLGARVEELARTDDDSYRITAGTRVLKANHVVVATGATNSPNVPTFADHLNPAIAQLHSSEYREPAQLRNGPVLIVGAGNSGAEIALDLASQHRVWLAGRDVGHIPVLHGFVYHLMKRVSVDTWLGRMLAAKGSSGGDPLGRVHPSDLMKVGVQRLARVTGVSRGKPMLEDGRVLDVENVVWCTGFIRDYGWIKLPGFDANRTPPDHCGVVSGEPGLYFVGLPFQCSLASHLVGGVGTDARHVVEEIARRVRKAHDVTAT